MASEIHHRFGLARDLEQRVGRILGELARYLAMAGGFVLAAIALMTVVSIIGRAFVFAGLRPIPGDFELVEAGIAVAVFSFMPWCQFNRGHVTVDILINRFNTRVRAAFGLAGNIALSIVALVVALRLWPGLREKFAYGETTFILGMPVWYGYALAMVGAAFFAIVCVYTVWRSFNEVSAGSIPKFGRPEH